MKLLSGPQIDWKDMASAYKNATGAEGVEFTKS